MMNWIRAARLRTLPLSLSGIILGNFLARWRMVEQGETWHWQTLVLTMVTAFLYQVLSNFANDYGDFQKGTDNEHRIGPIRTLQSGSIAPKQMKKAIVLFSILSLLSTLVLVLYVFSTHETGFYVFLGLGIASILSAIGYTMGKKAYAYLGLGDVFVLVFFGWVSVVGSYFLCTKHFDLDILLPATSVGLLGVAVLNLNNMRDIESDRITRKRTLALRLGYGRAMVYQIILMQLPLILMLVFMLINKQQEKRNYYAFLFMILFFPMMALRRKIMATKTPKDLDPFLKSVAMICFAMVVLVTMGLNYFH